MEQQETSRILQLITLGPIVPMSSSTTIECNFFLSIAPSCLTLLHLLQQLLRRLGWF